MRILTVAACACAALASGARAERASIGDEHLVIELTWDAGELTESGVQVDGRAVAGLAGVPWSARVGGASLVIGASLLERAKAGSDPRQQLTFSGSASGFDWRLAYAVTGPGRITKTLTLTPTCEQQLDEVTLWDASGSTPVVSRTTLQDIAAFYRDGDRGLFVSLDFPWSDIAVEGLRTRVSFPPQVRLAAGERFECHSLTIGATRLTGTTRYGYDVGEIDAMDHYVQERFPVRFERPMILSCSINNRYTQPREGVIFYTMKDHPTLCVHTDLLERELALMPQLGVEYYQVFPGVFDWAPGDPAPAEVDRLVQVARGHGVRMGDYSGASSVFCPHYNEHGNRLDRPEWLIRTADGRSTGVFCFGCPAFVDYYAGTVVAAARRHGFELHCLDFLSMQPCSAPDHAHPPGRAGLYHQVRGLVRLLEAINAVSPQMMTWSNSGNWAELLPKIAWSNPNLYLTDPFIATPWQGLNMTRLLDDARREQMVSLHNTRFIPYRFLTNCQYFFSQNSIVPDIRNYQYGALSTLAVTPNLCLGEIRPWLDRLSARDRDEVIAFYRRWTDFVREHFALWTRTCQAGENPGPGGVEIYGHADGSRGFIFVVNPHYWGRDVRIPLDATLGFTGEGRCELAELYPVERLRLTPEGTTVALGSIVPVHVPGQQVLVLEVRPAPERATAPRLYGLPGSIERTSEGYRVRTRMPQGTSERFAVTVPEGMPRPTRARVRDDVPRRPARYRDATSLSIAGTDGAALLMDIQFRRKPAPTELRTWSVRSGSVEEGVKNGWQKGFSAGEPVRFPLFIDVAEPTLSLPLDVSQLERLGAGPLAVFCGAYIENAFSEEQETWIDLDPSGGSVPMTHPAPDNPAKAAPLHPLARDKGTSWWLQTDFELPFMYTIGAEPFFDEHTFLVLPLVRPERVKALQAWVNGVPLEVEVYRYPRNRAFSCRYADLVGSGARAGFNRLVLHIQAEQR